MAQTNLETPREKQPSPFLLPQEVAALLRLPKNTVYEHARTGLLPCVRIGRAMRFRRSDIEAWLESGGATFEGGWRKEVEVPRQ